MEQIKHKILSRKKIPIEENEILAVLEEIKNKNEILEDFEKIKNNVKQTNETMEELIEKEFN